ncbi:MAG: ribose-phosphate diphosphokinase [Candidatus Hodgkinia cicadicola]
MQIYTTTHQPLCNAVQSYLNIPPAAVNVTRFRDGEALISLTSEPAGDETAVVIQSIAPPVNDALVHTLFLLETLRLACVTHVVLVLTYLGYSRQDRQTTPLSLASASLVCKLLSTPIVSKVYVLEPHSPSITSFFGVPAFELSVAPMICWHISETYPLDEIVILSLDRGSDERALQIAEALDVPIARGVKRRTENGVRVAFCAEANMINKTGIIIDDIVDSGESANQAIAELMSIHSLSNVVVYCIHALLSAGAPLGVKLYTSNSLCNRSADLDVSFMISRILKRISSNQSHNNLIWN